MADEHVMSNYFLVAVGHAGHQWLVSLPANYFDSWQELKQAFIDNFIATCEQPGNKYDLQWIRDRKDEPLREYVRCFSEMCIKVPSISDNEAIEAFITSLCFHDALRDKLLRKRPKSVTVLLATAKKYADADDAKKIIIEEAARVPRSDHPPHRDDYRGNHGQNNNFDCCNQRNNSRDHHDQHNQWRNRRDDYRGKRAREDDGEVNTIKKGGGRRNYEEDYAKALKGPCQLHPKSNHTMENCRILKSIYTCQQAPDTSDKPNDAWEQRNEDNDDEDADPRHKYVKPADRVHTIIRGKVSIETKRERKLLARACLNVANTDNLITDPRLSPWSHREISFSRKDQWAAISEPGRFPLVLDPCINKV
jgi:hypothetical protein